MTGYPPAAAGGRGIAWARPVVCGALPAALLAALATVVTVGWSRLPGRVADHWTMAGTANGAAPRLAPFLLLGGLALVGMALVAAAWATARAAARATAHAAVRGGTLGSGSVSRFGVVLRSGLGRSRGLPTASAVATLAGTGVFLIAISTAVAIMVTVANAGTADWRSASVGAGAIAALFAGPAALAAGAGALLRRYGGLGAAASAAAGAEAAAPRPSLGLRPGERAVWTGRARARWAWPAGIASLAAAAALGFLAQWTPTAAALALGVVLMAGFTSVRVTVGARGVTVAYGAFGLRLTRFPLRRIARADAVPRTRFGFGYRGSLAIFGSAAVAVRRGPALSLTLRDGKTFVVTVDDAATGAALLNDLIAAASRG